MHFDDYLRQISMESRAELTKAILYLSGSVLCFGIIVVMFASQPAGIIPLGILVTGVIILGQAGVKAILARSHLRKVR